MSVQVRPAEKNDAAALGRMGAGLVRFHHGLDEARFILPADDLESGYSWWLRKELRDPAAAVLVAQKDGALVGYAYGRVEDMDWGKLRGPCGEFIDLWVDEAARRTGAGRALCDALVQHFRGRGVRQVVLYAASRNARAQALFESLGFRPTMVELTMDL